VLLSNPSVEELAKKIDETGRQLSPKVAAVSEKLPYLPDLI